MSFDDFRCIARGLIRDPWFFDLERRADAMGQHALANLCRARRAERIAWLVLLLFVACAAGSVLLAFL